MLQIVPPEPLAERPGLEPDDRRWRRAWLRELRRVPADAVWPRLMTVPHPDAKGSLGKQFIEWAEAREGRPLRWWQRLVATRLLEVDKSGALVWEAMVLSMARQLGKSWLLRELCMWRIHQGDRFGEPQNLVHTGKDLQVCQEVQLDARRWAKDRPELYKVREVNGQEQIQYLPDRSRWMLRAKEAAYGLSLSVVAVDEAWKVRPKTVNESITPTMVERVQPQLWLMSTAHRMATPLMLSRRTMALDHLEDGEGDLLIEWSAPVDANFDDVDTWRLASPHWTEQRERMVAAALETARTGETHDPDEPDPIESFKAQWLNQWPKKRTETLEGDELLPAGQWAALMAPGLVTADPIWVAVEDDYGRGAAVAAAATTEDGRIEVEGWLCDDWDAAINDVLELGSHRRIRQLLIGANMLARVPPGTTPPPQARGSRETRPGLALLRDLAAGGLVVHDSGTEELNEAVSQARVKMAPTGLYLVSTIGKPHLVRAMVWAVQAAHKPAPAPMIH